MDATRPRAGPVVSMAWPPLGHPGQRECRSRVWHGFCSKPSLEAGVRASLTPPGRSPGAMACMSCGCDAILQSWGNMSFGRSHGKMSRMQAINQQRSQ